MILKHTKFDGLYRGAFFAALNMSLESIDRVKRFMSEQMQRKCPWDRRKQSSVPRNKL